MAGIFFLYDTCSEIFFVLNNCWIVVCWTRDPGIRDGKKSGSGLEYTPGSATLFFQKGI